MEAQNARRISVGGFLMASYLQRLLQLKWPSVMAAITLSRAEVYNYIHIVPASALRLRGGGTRTGMACAVLTHILTLVSSLFQLLAVAYGDFFSNTHKSLVVRWSSVSHQLY